MPTLVSTGQITIIDTNDARPITAYLTSNPGTQQVYSKDNDTVSFTPSWMTANGNTGIQITAKVYVGGVGGASDETANLSNRKFCLTAGGAAIVNYSVGPPVVNATTSTSFVNDAGTVVTTPFTVTHDSAGSNIKIKGNLLDSVASCVLFFEGDYTDPATSLVSHVIVQITLNTVKTGTNAIYILTRGNNTIEGQVAGKEVTAIGADLVRSSGVDTSNLSYKWYASGGATQISTSLSGYATKYGLKTTAAGTSPAALGSELGVNIPAVGAGNVYNTLVISEDAVTDIGIYRCDITDSADAKTYSSFFTVYDISDPYDLRLYSNSGDKLQNGNGSTTITPSVYYGAKLVANLTGWSFTWVFYDKDGKRAAFVDTAKISTTGGASISAANGTGASATIPYGGTSYAFVAGDIVKAVKSNGIAFYYEVASSTTNVVTIRTPVTNTWLNFTNYPAPSAASDFTGGALYGCTTGGTRTTSGAAPLLPKLPVRNLN
jgi:hypothetical protein